MHVNHRTITCLFCSNRQCSVTLDVIGREVYTCAKCTAVFNAKTRDVVRAMAGRKRTGILNDAVDKVTT